MKKIITISIFALVFTSCSGSYVGVPNQKAKSVEGAGGSVDNGNSNAICKIDKNYWLKNVQCNPAPAPICPDLTPLLNCNNAGVTIVASGTQTYYIGDKVKFSGTNMVSDKTYLLITGPGLPPEGARLSDLTPVVNADPNTFDSTNVLSDHTWYFTWDSYLPMNLLPCSYTIYAVTQPVGVNSLLTCKSITVELKKPFVSVMMSKSTYYVGETAKIMGTHEGAGGGYGLSGRPTYFFIKGANLPEEGAKPSFLTAVVNLDSSTFDSIDTNGDASFSFSWNLSSSYSPGHYFVVAEMAPMDINSVYSCVATFTKAWFMLLPAPLSGGDYITVDPISDKHTCLTSNQFPVVFTVTAKTSLPVDTQLNIKILAGGPQYDRVLDSVKVKSGIGGVNTISFDVDTTGFAPDEYFVLITDINGKGVAPSFNVLE